MCRIAAKDQHGATAVELAVVLVLLLSLIFGIMELGLYLYNKHVITNAAREAARFGVVSRTPRRSNNAIRNAAVTYAQTYLVTFGSGTPVVCINEFPPSGCTDRTVDTDIPAPGTGTQRCVHFGCDLPVRIDYPYDFLFLSTVGFGPKTIREVTVMKME